MASATPSAPNSGQRPLGAVKLQNRPKNAKAVAPGGQLRRRSARPRVVRRRDLPHRQFELERVDGQLRLDLKAAGENGKRFHETARERPIAGQNVGERASEHVGDKAGQQPVAGAMAAAIGRRFAIDTGSDHHIEPLVDELGDHRRRARRVIGGVAVDQHIDVGFDVIEHPPHHVALALIGLAANHRACARAQPRPSGRWSYCRRRTRPPRAAPRGSRRPPWQWRVLHCSTAPEPPPDTGLRLRPRYALRCLTLPLSTAAPMNVIGAAERPQPWRFYRATGGYCRLTIAFLCLRVPNVADLKFQDSTASSDGNCKSKTNTRTANLLVFLCI